MSNEENHTFWDDLAPLVDGDPEVVARQADALETSDVLRDARHEAQEAADAVRQAGDDYQHPDDFVTKVLAAVDALAEDAGTDVPAEGRATDPSGTFGDAEPLAPDSSREASSENEALGSAPAKPERRGGGLVLLFGGGLAMAAVAAAALLVVGGVVWWLQHKPTETAAAEVLTGEVLEFARAGEGTESGLTIAGSGTAQTTLKVGSTIPEGSAVRTDDRTRARIRLSDGSTVTLNHGTEIGFATDRGRKLTLETGELIAEIAHLEDGPSALLETHAGKIEVLGTKFQLSADEEQTTVRVLRGHVRFSALTESGQQVDVRAGQEATVQGTSAPVLSPALDLASSLTWSELVDGSGAEQPIRGIGELRARRPGETRDQERPLAIAEHKATVRIVGNVARTEVEETFQNDGAHALEGIFRFPLPSGARIASLQLLVDGTWEEGAIVDRERAKKIWRGVIRNATPERQRRQKREEYIWVPGPWRDPALLEWQRGGQFELRIFPIPARGSRSVRIAYTEDIAPRGASGRRYVHPLSHSVDGSTSIGSFDVDIKVSGHEGSVQGHGYPLERRNDGAATHLSFHASQFVPRGDLMVDYAVPNPDAEARWWTFEGDAAVAPAADSREPDSAVRDAQQAIAADQRPYVAFALRPKLPAWTRSEAKHYVFLVDSSQSMVGERYKRAVKLVSTVVQEMDRRDRFSVLACDVRCQRVDSEASSQIPGAEAAATVADALSDIEPGGASHLTAALRAAASSQQRAANGEASMPTHVLYVGDGMPSVGVRSAAGLHHVVSQLVKDQPSLSLSTVAIGGDADTRLLEEVARAGGGHAIRYVPGQSVTQSALTVLEASYGPSLRNPQVTFPQGIADIAPASLPTLRAGEEVWVVGRLEGAAQRGLEGSVKVSGTVAGEHYEQDIPIVLEVSQSRGNAFVPRKWASLTIEALELSKGSEDRTQIVALSKGYGVMSRHTSLLVLESEAMFRAFKVDRGQPALQWTGEEDVVMGESESASGGADGEKAWGDGTDNLLGAAGASVEANPYGSGRSVASRGAGRPVLRMRRAPVASSMASLPAPLQEAAAGAERELRAADSAPLRQPLASRPARRPRGPGRWMKREWFWTARISHAGEPSAGARRRVSDAETELRAQPDSRDRHRTLVRALAAADDVTRALEVTSDWIERDPLDAEALTHKANLLARLGRRDEAARALSGVVDLRPDDVARHTQLAKALARIGRTAEACAHQITLGELAAPELERRWREASDPRSTTGRRRRRAPVPRWLREGLATLHEAQRCLSQTSDTSGWDIGLADAGLAARLQAHGRTNSASGRETARGVLTVEGEWTGGSDLDLALVDRNGTRISWMGGRRTVAVEHGTSSTGEKLGLRWAASGSYQVEVSRSDASDDRPVSGHLTIRVHGERQRLAFALSPADERAAVGRVSVRRESRMVPVSGPLPLR